MKLRDPLGWKSSYLANRILSRKQRNWSWKERNWLEGYSSACTIVRKVGEPGFWNRQDRKFKQHLITAKIKPKVNPLRLPPLLNTWAMPCTASTACHWTQTPSLETQLTVAAALTLCQNGPPIVPTSLHLSLLPDSKAGAGGPGLAWVPWTFGRQVSSIFHFNNERRLRHLAKTHKWGVSPNWKMDSNAGKPEKWKMSVIIAD